MSKDDGWKGQAIRGGIDILKWIIIILIISNLLGLT
jgi:hypothetical protein